MIELKSPNVGWQWHEVHKTRQAHETDEDYRYNLLMNKSCTSLEKGFENVTQCLKPKSWQKWHDFSDHKYPDLGQSCCGWMVQGLWVEMLVFLVTDSSTVQGANYLYRVCTVHICSKIVRPTRHIHCIPGPNQLLWPILCNNQSRKNHAKLSKT